ncbi:MAG: hypothetical protein HY048_17090 [Acidobacteria bacterium]|nr:hypothetical protein [Acidobacteriota bacterium]
MRSAGLAALALIALTASGCFHMTTTLTVRADGSGTIDHRMLITNAGIAQLKQFGALAGGRGQNVDPISEEQARALAASIGPGVTYVSSTPTSTPIGQGRDAIYAFTDVSQLRISPRPAMPAGLPGAAGLNADASPITFSLTHEPSGNAVLHIHVPEPDFLGTLASPAAANQLAMVRMLLRGAQVSLMAEPAGALVHATSPYVEGSRVTLLGIDLDEILKDDASIAKLQTSTTQEEAQAVLGHLAGLKIDLTREITIEFTPAK